MELSACVTDDDFEAWRMVRMAVLPGERTDTVAELRSQASPTRLLMLARSDDGTVAGSGMADRSETAGGGFAAPRVLPEHRRKGVGTALLRALADHLLALDVPEIRGSVDDEGSLAFAQAFGFTEVDRQVEQVREVGEEPDPSPPPGVEIVTLSERPELWAECYEGFGREVLADFALFTPLDVSAEQWNGYWGGDPMFLALEDGRVVGCAGLHQDSDRPDRAENSLTAVSRRLRGRGLAAYLKRRTLHWAAAHGIRELYTWTQANNTPMITLNRRLGYVDRSVSITVARPLPLD